MPALLEAGQMAKRKAAPKRMGRPPSPEGPRRHVLNLRGRDEFKEWLAGFAHDQRADMADLVFEGLKMLAESRGYQPPPAR